MSKGNFSEFEASKSSTWRELEGTFNVLSSSVELIQGQILKHCTDKKNVERVLPVGSRTPDLQELVIDIFRLCIQRNIQLVLEWIPREENVVADEISKSTDEDDYMLSPDIFAALDILWGPHTIDHCSSFKTRQIPRFCSCWRNPGAEVIDALSVSWSSEYNWVFPPPFLVPKVLKHMPRYGADGTLIAPHWTSAPWWPLLLQAKGKFRKEIYAFLTIPPMHKYVYPGCPRINNVRLRKAKF